MTAKKSEVSLDDLIGSPPADGQSTAPSKESTDNSSKSSSTTRKKPAQKTDDAGSKRSSSRSSSASSAKSQKKAIPVTPLKPKFGTISDSGNSDNNDDEKSQKRGSNRSNSKGSSSNSKRNGKSQEDRPSQIIKGVLDTSRDGHGVLRVAYSQNDKDAYISTSQIRRFKLRPGDVVEGPAREPKENERYWGLLKVDTVNGRPVDEVLQEKRVKFHSLTPVYPDSQIKLEIGDEPVDLRIIDLIAPIGKGQRSLIVSPPKAGKTTLLKNISTGIAKNYPDAHLMAVLVGERPEEVTDISRHLAKLTDGKGEVAASNFDEPADDQCRVAELALERAKRLVEEGRDVVILLDSITRLARAYNLSIPTSGRTLSGGFDPAALFPPKRFFGAARNFEVPGSLTIIGTALIDTGSRMDDLVYEEFKGTGNQEVHLDRRLAERRIFPAIDPRRSGTRRDDLLIDSVTYQSVLTLHRMLDTLDKDEQANTLIQQLRRSKTNKEFLASLKAG